MKIKQAFLTGICRVSYSIIFIIVLFCPQPAVALSQSVSDEFLALGGKFGTVSNSQKTRNTQALQTIFKSHNGLVFEEKKRIQTQNLCITTQSHTVIRNIILENYYTQEVQYTIGVLKGVSYQEISNVTLVCLNKEMCKYGIKYGNENGRYSEGCTLNNITLSFYTYPLLLFTWNSVIGRIDCYKCYYGPILLGTSLSVGAIYCNGCNNGPLIGVNLDEKGRVISTAQNAYLTYSDIGIISTDGDDVGFCLGVGYSKYNNIGTIGIECKKAASIIKSFYKVSNTYTVGTIVPENDANKFYENYIKDKTPDNVCVTAVFGENITKALSNSDRVNMYIERSTPHLSRLKGSTSSVHIITPSFGVGPIRNDVYFESELINSGGNNNGSKTKTSNSFGKYAGLVTSGQRIRIRLRGSATLASSDDAVNRQIVFLGKLIVGDADQYNASHLLGETLINVALDSYRKGNSYKVTQTSEISGLGVSIDSTGELPSIIVEFPKGSDKHSYNYVYNLECIGGAYTSVEIE